MLPLKLIGKFFNLLELFISSQNFINFNKSSPTIKINNIFFIFFFTKSNEDVSYEFTIPGIYAYWCTPHKSLGMIGFVIVGDDKSNLDMIKKLRFFGQSKKLSKELIDQI